MWALLLALLCYWQQAADFLHPKFSMWPHLNKKIFVKVDRYPNSSCSLPLSSHLRALFLFSPLPTEQQWSICGGHITILWAKSSDSGRKKFPMKISFIFKLVTYCHTDQQKVAWFESNFYVSCAACITPLLTTDRLFAPNIFTDRILIRGATINRLIVRISDFPNESRFSLWNQFWA